jgi:hypothetical protein
MPIARDIHGTVFVGGTRTLQDRIVGSNSVAVVQADIASISYTIELLDGQDDAERTVVEGHEDVALVVSDVIFDTLQTPDDWTENRQLDAIGYNFAYEIDISDHAAFTLVGRLYLVTVTFVPDEGQPIVSRYRIKAI